LLLFELHCLKKRPNFETVQLEITWVNFDDIWQKYSEDSRIEVACFGFHVGLPVITLSSLKLHRGYRGGSPTAVQAWRTCPLWEPSPSHPILV